LCLRHFPTKISTVGHATFCCFLPREIFLLTFESPGQYQKSIQKTELAIQRAQRATPEDATGKFLVFTHLGAKRENRRPMSAIKKGNGLLPARFGRLLARIDYVCQVSGQWARVWSLRKNRSPLSKPSICTLGHAWLSLEPMSSMHAWLRPYRPKNGKIAEYNFFDIVILGVLFSKIQPNHGKDYTLRLLFAECAVSTAIGYARTTVGPRIFKFRLREQMINR
jgi:hypothetical protein